jgi:hypothetical protein
VHLCLTLCLSYLIYADQWGMDEECEYIRSSYLVKDEPSWAQLEDRLDILIGRDVNNCREAAIDDLEILEFAATVTEEEKVNRLLYLLQRDILGSRLGALIMEKKFLRDAFYQHKANYPSYALQFVGRGATQRQLIVFAVLAVLFGVSMVGYLLYFALAATAQRQRGWVSSFILWLVLDFVLVSTCEALLTNVAIPSAVKADLDAVKMHLAEVTRNAANDAAVTALVPASASPTNKSSSPTKKGSPGKSPFKRTKALFPLDTSSAKEQVVGFNSAHYFSCANRLSRYFTDLSESKFIQSYSSLLPPGHIARATWLRPTYHLIQQVDAAHTKRTKSLPRNAVFVSAAYPSIFQEDSLKLLCHYLLSNYLQGSFYMQDAVMQLIVTSMLFFLLLLHVQLYNAMPALTLLPFALVVGVVTLYLLMLLVRWLTKHFNEWNARRVAPFAERVVKAEHDEFVGEFETGGDLELDDTDLFEDLSMPAGHQQGAPASSPMKVTFKAQPKGYMSESAHQHSVQPYSDASSSDYFDSPRRFKPQVKSDSSSSGTSHDDKSDSSSYTSSSEDFEPQPKVVQHFPTRGKLQSNSHQRNAHGAKKTPAATPSPTRTNAVSHGTSSFATPVRAANKLKARSKLSGFGTPAKPSPSPQRQTSYAPDGTPTQGATQQQQGPTAPQVPAERPRDALSRAERLLALAEDDDPRTTSLYNVKSK